VDAASILTEGQGAHKRLGVKILQVSDAAPMNNTAYRLVLEFKTLLLQRLLIKIWVWCFTPVHERCL
jgi:hypothetical protein